MCIREEIENAEKERLRVLKEKQEFLKQRQEEKLKRAQKELEIFKEMGQRHEQNVQLIRESDEIVSRLDHGFQQFIHSMGKIEKESLPQGKMIGETQVSIVNEKGNYVSLDSLGLTAYPLYESLDMIHKESLTETQVAYYHKKKRKIAKKLVQAKNAFNERKLYYEQNPKMKEYMDTYKPMITFLEEQDQYIKTVEKLPVIKHVQQKYPSTPCIVSQVEVESLKNKMSEYFNHYEREARQN